MGTRHSGGEICVSVIKFLDLECKNSVYEDRKKIKLKRTHFAHENVSVSAFSLPLLVKCRTCLS